MDAEMHFHVDMEAEELLRERGLAPGEARRQALIAFAGLERYKDRARDIRISTRFEELGRDLRYGARVLVRRPGFTTVAVVTLALAIGATTAIFTIVNAVEGLGVAVVGVLIGLGAAAAVTRVLDSLLFEVSALDPLTFAAVAVFLAVISLVATYLPARRTTCVDPIVALRTE